jgi:imidazolonepropionase-like amidohydrolase
MQVLYRGGAVFDGETMLTGHAVLVDGERIKRVAKAAEFDGWSGHVVDTSRGTIVPGLIDCHVHLCLGGEPDPGTAADKLMPGQVTMRALERAQRSLAGGITALRDCGGKNYLEFPVRDACNGGSVLGPTIRASGKVICMTGGHGNRSGRIADGVDDVVKAVREQIHAGADLIKLMATGGVMTPGVNPEDAHYTFEEMAAGVGEARRFRKRSASHAQGSEGILNATRAGISSIEHGIFLIDECIEEMKLAGTYLVPTLAAVANIIAGKDKGIPAYAVEKSLRVAERHTASIKAFYAAGGRIAMGTDAGTPFNLHGENALELRYMAGIGIANADAIKFATVHGADLMGVADEGRIAEGHAADLLVVDGDPLQDIEAVADKKNHRLVLKRGRSVKHQPMPLAQAIPIAAAAF